MEQEYKLTLSMFSISISQFLSKIIPDEEAAVEATVEDG